MLEDIITSEELWSALDRIRGEDLFTVINHPKATEMHIVKILSRRDLSENFLQEVARSSWMKYQRVQFYVVNNPKTPPSEAMNFVRLLFWKDLNFVVTNFKLSSEIRHLAESVIIQRLPTMATGDKITLARITAGEVLKTLRLEKDPKVVSALLTNPRMTEEDILFIVNLSKTPSTILETICKSSKWSVRKEVKLALLRNSSTPTPYAISLLSGMTIQDLRLLQMDLKVPLLLRKMMETKLGSKNG
jgi:hypothetical protein